MLTEEKNPIRLEASWKRYLVGEFEQDYMGKLKTFLTQEYDQGKVIFPRKNQYFLAFEKTPLPKVKVVILGQDPYHGPGQAHGLCFSVPPGVPPPPSLVNIHRELKEDLGVDNRGQGHLLPWACQGVLLLNSVLTVEKGRAASHGHRGWESFTDQVISVLNNREKPMVFMLWGSYAQKKGAMVNGEKHLVLKAPHPSPLSAHRGFYGCRHFSRANEFLIQKDQSPVDWQLPNGR